MANKTKTVMKYILYLAGIAILGELIYFAVQGWNSPSKFAKLSETATAFAAIAAADQSIVITKIPSSMETQMPSRTLAPVSIIVPTLQYTRTLVPTNPVAINAVATNPPAATSRVSTATRLAPTVTSSVPTSTSSAPTALPVVGVPGITLAQVETKLVNEQNFYCTTKMEQKLNTLTCDYKTQIDTSRSSYNVQVYGRDATKILFIYSSVFQDKPDKAMAAEVLGNIAALPFKDQPQLEAEVRAWVNSELPTITSTTDERLKTVGGIQYRLYGSPNSWFFEIGSSTL
jgi:hypothetical protein